MYVHVFRSNGRSENKYVDVQPYMYPHGTAREVAYIVSQNCNLQNGDMAAFCIVGPYYDVTSPCFSIRSYAVAVEDNALYLAEYDYLNPSTFPDSVAYMSVIGDADYLI